MRFSTPCNSQWMVRIYFAELLPEVSEAPNAFVGRVALRFDNIFFILVIMSTMPPQQSQARVLLPLVVDPAKEEEREG